MSLSSAGPLSSLKIRDFRLYWIGSAISTAGTTMQQAGVAWQVYALTHSPVALGLIGLFRVIPLVLLSLIGGVVSDVLNRRRLMLVTQTILMLSSAGLAVVAFENVSSPVPIYVIITIAAAALAFNNPARQALIPSLVPREELSNAISLNAIAFEVATVVGPSLAGLIIALWSVGVIYVVDAVSFLAVLAALYVIRPREIEGRVPTISMAAAFDGLRFVFRTPIIFATTGLDFVATFFGSATALLPVFARDVLHSGAEGYGILYAAPSVGAIVTGIAMSVFVRRIEAQGRVIVIS
ncbi:MAG TPA: MFS transporter, partial [Chloroflexota bacterium]|nr:MFS transporter [Chloroflexota bacterium]